MSVHRRAPIRTRSKQPDVRTGNRLPAAETPPTAVRSWTMSRVRSKNTQPELLVRKAAHALGLRFRLHRRDLPGTPDLVFPGRLTTLFVHGCFWHRHGCARATTPASNVGYWAAKFERNVERDARNAAELRKLGWRCVRIWECETKDAKKLAGLLRRKVAAKPPRIRK